MSAKKQDIINRAKQWTVFADDDLRIAPDIPLSFQVVAHIELLPTTPSNVLKNI